LGIALSRTANLVCSRGIPRRRATARQRAGWSTFLPKTAQPTPQFRLKRCADAIRPVTNRAVPSVAPPRIVRLLSRYVGMWTLATEARPPSTGAQNTGFLRALHRDRRMRAAGDGVLPALVPLSRIASVIGVIVIAPTARPTATLTEASGP